MSAPRTATQGGDLTYDIEVGNAGPRAATGVTLVDALPGGVEFVSATPSVGTCSGTKDVTCSIESIPRDGRESVSIKVSPKQAGELVNTVNVAMNESDLVPSDNFATARTSVSPTAVAPPAASTGPASETVHTGATLNALVTPNGSGTTYRFEYGGNTSYGQKTPEQDAGSGMEAMLVEAVLEGLEPGATYHYRVVATSARGTVEGRDRTFTTPASSFARLDLKAKPASVKKGRATTLSGRLVDPSGDGLSRRETTLQARPQGAQRFSDVGEVTTGDDGAFAFRDVRPRGTTFYRVIFSGSEKDGLKASRSSTIRVVVRR